jgi:hypothetical protein
LGGAIFLRTGALTLTDCVFDNNSATGGQGSLGSASSSGGGGISGEDGTDGQGKGGAVFVLTGATARASGVIYFNNVASDADTTTDDNNDIFGAIQGPSAVSDWALYE